MNRQEIIEKFEKGLSNVHFKKNTVYIYLGFICLVICILAVPMGVLLYLPSETIDKFNKDSQKNIVIIIAGCLLAVGAVFSFFNFFMINRNNHHNKMILEKSGSEFYNIYLESFNFKNPGIDAKYVGVIPSRVFKDRKSLDLTFSHILANWNMDEVSEFRVKTIKGLNGVEKTQTNKIFLLSTSLIIFTKKYNQIDDNNSIIITRKKAKEDKESNIFLTGVEEFDNKFTIISNQDPSKVVTKKIIDDFLEQPLLFLDNKKMIIHNNKIIIQSILPKESSKVWKTDPLDYSNISMWSSRNKIARSIYNRIDRDFELCIDSLKCVLPLKIIK